MMNKKSKKKIFFKQNFFVTPALYQITVPYLKSQTSGTQARIHPQPCVT